MQKIFRFVLNRHSAKLFIFFVAIVFAGAENLYAQPGDCYPGSGGSTFSPWVTCSPSYLSEEFVFVGRVVSQDLRVIPVQGHPYGTIKMVVAVENPVKGKLKGEIELFLDWSCHESIEKGERRIFTATRVIDGKTTRLVSDQWSTSLKEISADDLAGIVKKIQRVLKEGKQPRIIGKLVRYETDGRYPIGFSRDRVRILNSKLGYDQEFGRPLGGTSLNYVVHSSTHISAWIEDTPSANIGVVTLHGNAVSELVFVVTQTQF